MYDLSEKRTPRELQTLARQAGAAILSFYTSLHRDAGTRGGTTGYDGGVDTKLDGSPLTKADLTAHDIIVDGLSQLSDPALAALPVLSEESATIEWAGRRKWDRYWLVDPLDGTKEFIKRNGEFTVNIALIDQGKPILGVVYAPALDQLFLGLNGFAGMYEAWKMSNDRSQLLDLRPQPPQAAGEPTRIVVSRSHRGDEALSHFFQQPHVLVPMGSSLKLCAIADCSADIYPRLGPTSEWDIAAGHAVVEAAGGSVKTTEGEALRYNQKESLINPHFFASSPWFHHG